MTRKLELQLDWSAYDSYGQGDAYAAVPAQGEGFGKAAALCIGSRQCQKAGGQAGDKGVMCPSFRVTQHELHSTRGRAAALRDALNGTLGAQPFVDGALAAAMDLCVACKGCKRECPNGVDMAALRAETLAQRWAGGTRLPLRTRLFAALPHWLPRLHAWRWLLLPALALRERVPALARGMERALGIAARRSVPRPAARPFLAQATASPAPAASAQHEVVLLVDCFANHLEPDVAHAALDLLQASGYRVHLLRPAAGSAPLCCGRSAFSAGQIAAARGHARRLLEALAPHAAAGRSIIGLEPSCLSMLRDEAHQLGLDAIPVQAVSKAALMLEEFLARELDARRWTPPQGGPAARALVHGHCHQKAFGTLKALRKVLAALPTLQVDWIEASCCGMAGSFGFEAEHYDLSMRMAELALLPAVRGAPPEALIVASGTSCRQQIRDGAGRRPLHLAQLLQRLLVPAEAAARAGRRAERAAGPPASAPRATSWPFMAPGGHSACPSGEGLR
ncbi:(Fe-S)-binding protein [Methylibium sp.]|uniref:(Fe-S)-binding protein n=1 Tax=Methylibium sp. TaxID=2067992 RepID=UPI003D0A188A